MRRFFNDSIGATAIEYGLLMALVFLVFVGAAVSVAEKTTALWSDVSSHVK